MGHYFVGDCQCLDARNEAVVPADRAPEEALMAKAVERALLAISLATSPVRASDCAAR